MIERHEIQKHAKVFILMDNKEPLQLSYFFFNPDRKFFKFNPINISKLFVNIEIVIINPLLQYIKNS